MNIREELLREHSKANAENIAAYATGSTAHFDELMQCFLSDEKRLSQVAGYSVNKAVKLNPLLVQPYLKQLVQQLKRKDVHGAITRNCMNIFELVATPEALHGELMNLSFAFIENAETEIAVKASSLTVLFKLSKIYPEIKDELKLIIETKWDTETAAFKARGRKILEALKKC